MDITVLVENTAVDGYTAEHGLSLLIAYEGSQYLLDAGETDAFAQNARTANADLPAVAAAALSHAHIDHAGGLCTFLSLNSHANVYLREEALTANCRNAKDEYIGPPSELFSRFASRLVPVASDRQQIANGVWLLAHHADRCMSAPSNTGLFVKRGNELQPDDFSHEQSLVFEEDGGIVVLNSCCHVGADAVAEEALDAFPGKKLKALVGGFHLSHPAMGTAPEEHVRQLAERLAELGAGQILTGHCTGAEPLEMLQRFLGDRVRPLRSGLSFSL